MQRQMGKGALYFWPVMAALGGVISAAPAFAQNADKIRLKSVLDLPREGYEPRTLHAGNIIIRPEMDVRGEYDSNIYADETDEVDDFVLVAAPRVRFDLNNDLLKWRTDAFATLRRHADKTSENSTAFGATTDITLRPSAMSTLGGGLGFERQVEDRGDPESRTLTDIGPRRLNDFSGNAFYRLTGARLGVQASGEVHKLNYLRSLDDERDYTSYRGALRGFYRMSPLINLYVQGYVNRRDFRQAADDAGVNRDASTFGGTVGAEFDPGGKLRGELNVGVFRFDPKDRTLKPYTGLQFAAAMSYAIRPRTAITLDAFRGDVATVRTGALARTDTRIGIGVQQEVRHNLLFNAGLSWRQTDYRGTSDQTQRIWGGNVEAEYLLNRHLSIAAMGWYKHRNSDAPDEDYERFRAGLELRFKY